jgi:hypothetical protein
MNTGLQDTQVSRRLGPAVQLAEPCPHCSRPLPIRAAVHGETSAHWECEACHSPLTGVLIKQVASKLAYHVRLSASHFDTGDVAAVPASLRQLVQEFVARRQNRKSEQERRSSPRIPSQLDIALLPLDERWAPAGKPHMGVVVDLSVQGLGIVATTKFEATHVALQIRYPAGIVQLVGQIVWSNPIGHEFHHAGVKFVLRLGRSTIGGDHA